MSAKFTPGPWNNDDGIIYPPDDCDGQVWIADVRSATNCEANARLIAAAPELYEAADEAANMLPHADGCRWWDKNISELDSAEAIDANNARCNCPLSALRAALAKVDA